jgi:small subunit ribosomal protein S19
MTRSKWKVDVLNKFILKTVYKNKLFLTRKRLGSNLTKQRRFNVKPFRSKILIKIWDRSLKIEQDFVNFRFQIYNGHVFIPVFITQAMVGLRFGELVFTRRAVVHKLKKSKK